MDLAKYRALFLEEATDHLGEISRALLLLEKDPASRDAIDLVFRMAHSIKSMAASLGYDGIAELSHKLEDRMDRVRSAGRVAPGEETALLFRGLQALERMVATVEQTGEAPPADPDLARELARGGDAPGDDGLKKKALTSSLLRRSRRP
ncbi:MAG TPA: Hpt domain-containing protein [Myxococcota bacterium]|nr:Hpt domain-containing protein [Myxococcota bacterium]